MRFMSTENELLYSDWHPHRQEPLQMIGPIDPSVVFANARFVPTLAHSLAFSVSLVVCTNCYDTHTSKREIQSISSC